MRAHETEIAIVGAGQTGAPLALALAQAGFDVALIDARDPEAAPPADMRNFAIVTGSWRLLKAIGIADEIVSDTVALHGLEAVDGGTHWFGAPQVLFGDEDLTLRNEDETLGRMVQASILQAALDKAIATEPKITLFAPARFSHADATPGQIKLHLEDGTAIKARLLVGSDGMNSPVREDAGIPTVGRDYNKSVFVANVALSEPHHGIARQLFTPEGPFATLPLSGDRANLAWYMKRGAAEALSKGPVEEAEAELNYRFEDFCGKMAIEGRMGAYPLILQIAENLVAERVALVGDAARRSNPLAGQGLDQGLHDVAALYDAIVDADHAGLDIGSPQALGVYETARRFNAASAALALDGIDRLFSNDHMLTKPVRGLGLMLAEKIAPLRQAIAGVASASGPDLPRLMQPSESVIS